MKADREPTKGSTGDPYKPAAKFSEIMKQRHVEVEKPKFIRDNMNIDDIMGTRSKPVYQGLAKDILRNNDIDGTQPRYERVSIVIRVTLKVIPLFRSGVFLKKASVFINRLEISQCAYGV